MKPISFLIALFLSCSEQFAQAQQISVADAQDNATEWLVKCLPRGANGRSANRTELTLAYTGQIEDEVQYYVFNRPNDEGFVIVGADERATQILGYVDHGSFDYEHIPDNMRLFLVEHQQQIHNAIQRQLTPAPKQSAPKGATQAKTNVPDLVKAEWDQMNPFNCVFPTMSTGSKIYTGCVNTAVAQIMKRWNYPQHGIGNKSVTKYVYGYDTGETITFTADFENTNYQWDKMLNKYNLTPRDNDYLCSDPEENQRAVSTLIYHVSIATGTSYGSYGTTYHSNGSGANEVNAAMGLIQYFGYANTMSNRNRICYTDDEWEDLLYNELANGRPILYSGRTNSSGHAFVCHGYDASNNTFAINWGWDGSCNGYFSMRGTKILTPNGTGSGGGAAGSSYSKEQSAIIGISPSSDITYDTGSVKCGPADTSNPYFITNNESGEQTSNFTTGDMIKLENIKIFEEFFDTKKLRTNLKLVNTSTGDSYIITPRYWSTGFGSPSASISYIHSTITNNVPSGEYKVIPIYGFADNEDWDNIPVPTEDVYPTITVEYQNKPIVYYSNLYFNSETEHELTVKYSSTWYRINIAFATYESYVSNSDIYVAFKLKSETDEYISSYIARTSFQKAKYGYSKYPTQIYVDNVRKNGKYKIIPMCKSEFGDEWLEMPVSGNPEPCYITVTDCPLYGDVDLDNDLDQLDVETLVEMLINKRTSTLRADVDGNGSSTISDVTTVIELLK